MVQYVDVTSADFTECILVYVRGLVVNERKIFVFQTKLPKPFLLSILAAIISLCWRQHLDTSPTSTVCSSDASRKYTHLVWKTWIKNGIVRNFSCFSLFGRQFKILKKILITKKSDNPDCMMKSEKFWDIQKGLAAMVNWCDQTWPSGHQSKSCISCPAPSTSLGPHCHSSGRAFPEVTSLTFTMNRRHHRPGVPSDWRLREGFDASPQSSSY